ncbi:PQQ-binding-like beta-propeller repeat protein [Ponticoccus sp. SC2-23]|uniref:PQQ-like beta-propeller repeat protein n=1 Tax=Alexandriicola marinus TaxID=2081710 RepID=UPI000FDBFB3F|nr:PQQ-like beta-propeller repeat protein [Alexandriicola marinus]MBM1222387.1 PQQ-binding-like beta-propeller repeat protein [Ponticoccus sp. SC6-9]MBM1224500.1 PQQ-binding-like beta-propeller repeat protein [Ponticoccus sp. SC6-15]MBM1229720.1 PQQ-binding-like beta-propeller repeat protein [Ponticoccus sp. SC6-38]MBM1233466.1 PQQ-binding-like beta-propeller repeat protein [Ponticoccus sp. SC6-45]MBM1236584.1 PQQ-binding-like beta-propeller repeat protein [Ponticoccus sp. SC6-49]MBM1244628.1
MGLALAILAGCGEQDVILPGERLDIRDGLIGGEAEVSSNVARPISLPSQQVNADYTHRGGSAVHYITHPALSASLTRAFSVDIGEGNSRRARITADPVIADGRIFTLDARSRVSAFTTRGDPLWTTDLTPPTDSAADASGGGLAVGGGTLYVTTGFGELVALDVATGGERWVQDLDAPGGSAPTVRGDLVYVVARDSRAWAVERSDGRVRWQISGTPPGANFSGGAGAAVTSDIAVFPFPSGEILAAFPEGGVRRWSSVIAGERLGRAAAVAANDIAADPVIVGNTIYVGNVSGRVVAMRLDTGDRVWTAAEGATSPVLPVGGSVFFVNDLGELVRLDAGNGSVIWRVALPVEEEGEFWEGTTRFVQYGPILAGGRLIVASSEGLLRQFDPVSGALVGSVALPGGAASHPVVAGGILYVVSADGQLQAFR